MKITEILNLPYKSISYKSKSPKKGLFLGLFDDKSMSKHQKIDKKMRQLIDAGFNLAPKLSLDCRHPAPFQLAGPGEVVRQALPYWLRRAWPIGH